MPTIRIEQDVFDGLKKLAEPFVDTPGAVIRRLLTETGFRIREIRGIPAPFPKVFGNGLVGRGALAINAFLICVSPTLFSYQIFVVADTTPDVDFVLQEAGTRNAGDVPSFPGAEGEGDLDRPGPAETTD